MLMRHDQLLEWVKPVRQERSRRTLERLLDAAEAVILEGGVEACSVSAVVARAGSSVGAFYARFPDKDSLLRAVCERFLAESRATIEAALDASRWEDEPLPNVIFAMIRFMLRMGSARRALLACMLTYAAADPELALAVDGVSAECGARLHRFLAERGELPAQPAPELSAHILASLLFHYIQAAAMRGAAHQAPCDEARLAEELTRLSLAYLGKAAPNAAPASQLASRADAARSSHS